MTENASPGSVGLLASLLAEEAFRPIEPRTLPEAGLSESLLDSLICKHLAIVGIHSGRQIARFLCLPFGILEERLGAMRSRRLVTHKGAAALNDYLYALTEEGRDQAQIYHEACSYVGPAPVPLDDYINSVEAQTIRAEAPKRAQLEKAFEEISVEPSLFDCLGPAVNSGAGLFLYGAPGNGKTTLAERITLCFGQAIWLPQTLIADGEIIKLFDPAYHELISQESSTGSALQDALISDDTGDQRWIKVRRPTVVAGGELTMDSLEIRHNSVSKVSEAPLQMKSNCGSLLIDDFGRQRMDPVQLLNRWIVPLEKHYDFLTLATGKKIQVPFDQLIIFSTNLEPKDLVDEAFLRRIPYKINVSDPDDAEFHRLFELYAQSVECEYKSQVVDYLLETHYRAVSRPLRRCHPRDLLHQISNYCKYNSLPMEMKPEYFDLVVENYFTVVGE